MDKQNYKVKENYNKITKEVVKVIQDLKPKKSVSLDGIYNAHIQDSTRQLAELWTTAFNKCFQTGNIPKTWRSSTIKGIYKGKGNIESPDAYRGIALENTSLKLFTKIITVVCIKKQNFISLTNSLASERAGQLFRQ